MPPVSSSFEKKRFCPHRQAGDQPDTPLHSERLCPGVGGQADKGKASFGGSESHNSHLGRGLL